MYVCVTVNTQCQVHLTNTVSLKLKYNYGITEYRKFFHGTYRGAKSVVPRNTTITYRLYYKHCQKSKFNYSLLIDG